MFVRVVSAARQSTSLSALPRVLVGAVTESIVRNTNQHNSDLPTLRSYLQLSVIGYRSASRGDIYSRISTCCVVAQLL